VAESREVSVKEFRRSVGALLTEVATYGRTIYITRLGLRIAALMPPPSMTGGAPEVSVTDVRGHLAGILHAVATRGRVVYVTRLDLRVAALIPVTMAEEREGEIK
jgi:antitoxin (DNA-binding transcriptional repressor) of toxin-antitoxin stability system